MRFTVDEPGILLERRLCVEVFRAFRLRFIPLVALDEQLRVTSA